MSEKSPLAALPEEWDLVPMNSEAVPPMPMQSSEAHKDESLADIERARAMIEKAMGAVEAMEGKESMKPWERNEDRESENRAFSDPEYNALSKECEKWSEFGPLGGKLAKGAHNLEMVGGIGGGLALIGGLNYGVFIQGGEYLTNSFSFYGVVTAAASIAVGEAIKMYRRHKEEGAKEQAQKKFHELVG